MGSILRCLSSFLRAPLVACALGQGGEALLGHGEQEKVCVVSICGMRNGVRACVHTCAIFCGNVVVVVFFTLKKKRKCDG